MKRNLLFFASLALAFTLLQSFGDPNGSKKPSGSPGGYSGSPHDAKNCTNCHGGSPVTVSGWITSNVPGTGYVPGTSYIITVTATGSGKKGFEVSPQSSMGMCLGTLTPGSGQHLCNSNKAVTHSSTINTSTATWNFTWVAPPSGTGTVTFYGALVVSYSNTKITTLSIPESTTGISENTATAIKVYPSPVLDHLCFSAFIPKVMKLRASIFDLSGRSVTVLMDESVAAGNLDKNFELPSSLNKGVYILAVEGEGISETKKFIVQ